MAISSSKLATSRVRYQVSRLQTRAQLAAVLDCLFELDPKRTSPILVELALVDERLLFARAEGDATFKHFVGRTDELSTELLGFARHLGLGEVEHAYIREKIAAIPRLE